jgi:hypothetical protein
MIASIDTLITDISDDEKSLRDDLLLDALIDVFSEAQLFGMVPVVAASKQFMTDLRTTRLTRPDRLLRLRNIRGLIQANDRSPAFSS